MHLLWESIEKVDFIMRKSRVLPPKFAGNGKNGDYYVLCGKFVSDEKY
jgi:hypothetical protein